MSKIGHTVAVSMGRGTLFGVFASFTMMATRFITVPIITAHIGLGGYGIWSIIMTTSAYMRFGTAGLKSAFQKYVAEATGDGNYERASQLMTTGSALMLVLSLIALIPVAIFSKLLAKVAGVPAEFLSAAAASFTILAIIMILSNFAAVFEAIVNGCHRVDIVRKFYIGAALCEAIAIVACMFLGFGLLAMTIVMAAAEVGIIICCFVASSRLLPQIQIRRRYLSLGVVPELFRFAGSYQLVNVLEILSMSILPFGILRLLGARASGVYAICTRLTGVGSSIQDASLLPLLSGGTLLYASQATEQIRLVMNKMFKWTLVVTIAPLAFVAVFGPTLVMAWTGQSDPMFRVGLPWLCIAAAFGGISRTGLILYRANGGALMDVLRQLLVIVGLVIAIALGRDLGYAGIFAAMAFTETIGALFMLHALQKSIEAFHPSDLIPDAAKIIVAVSIVLLAGIVMTNVIPIPWNVGDHVTAWLRLMLAGSACAILAWPAMALKKCLSAAERRTIVDALFPSRGRAATSV
jgi:O-antigen/teichoic acid export membrane protein